jgi:3-deoxy-D-manno-octulosonic-acid transferase
MMVDTIGHLSRMYKYCNVAIVGGGFTTGIHNILEPMVFGLPVFFGPDHKSFWEAQASINQGLNYQFTNYKELMTELTKWLQNPALIKEHQPKALQFIVKGSGATKTVTSYLLKKIK